MSTHTHTPIRRTPRHSVRGEADDFLDLARCAFRAEQPVMQTMGSFLAAAAANDVPRKNAEGVQRKDTRVRFWAAPDDDVQEIRAWRERQGLSWPQAIHIAATLARRDSTLSV